MSDPAAPAAAPILNNYRIVCINGFSVAVASPDSLPDFVQKAKGAGGIPSDKMWIVYHNIVTIDFIGPFVPGQVSQLRPVD
jgi:hypothetical protein